MEKGLRCPDVRREAVGDGFLQNGRRRDSISADAYIASRFLLITKATDSMATLGVIVGNRGFFPDHLCSEGRKTILDVLGRHGITAVITLEDATNNGAIETLAEARRCADLFKEHRDEIDGVLVTLPNFGDERAIANTLRWSGLDVPVLIHAFKDSADQMSIQYRRDSFCGKMSACNNLHQYGIKYSLTSEHTMDPESDAFSADLQRFVAVCRTAKSLKERPAWGRSGRGPPPSTRSATARSCSSARGSQSRRWISLNSLDGFARWATTRQPVKAKLDEMTGYTRVDGIPQESLVKMAKLGVVIDRFMDEQGLAATAIQCWTAIEEFYGVVPCTCMSMMSNNLMASACEADIAGVVSMYALQQASGVPAALLDWNNNYGNEANKGVVFHCSNLPKAFLGGEQRMDYQEIIAGSVGKENTYGTIVGQIAPGPFTYCRVSTDDFAGTIRAYAGEGRFTDDRLQTFGGYGVFEVPEMQGLLRFICQNGFEHHVAATRAQVGSVLEEALSTYLSWEVYHHGDPQPMMSASGDGADVGAAEVKVGSGAV